MRSALRGFPPQRREARGTRTVAVVLLPALSLNQLLNCCAHVIVDAGSLSSESHTGTIALGEVAKSHDTHQQC